MCHTLGRFLWHFTVVTGVKVMTLSLLLRRNWSIGAVLIIVPALQLLVPRCSQIPGEVEILGTLMMTTSGNSPQFFHELDHGVQCDLNVWCKLLCTTRRCAVSRHWECRVQNLVGSVALCDGSHTVNAWCGAAHIAPCLRYLTKGKLV